MEGHWGLRDELFRDHLGWYVLGTTKELDMRVWGNRLGPEQEELLSRLRRWGLILEAAGDCWNVPS